MFSSKKLAIAVFSILVGTSATAAGFNLTVDSINNCLDMKTSTLLGTAQIPIEPGQYSVKISKSTTNFCKDTSCPTSAVILLISTGVYEPSKWLYVVETGRSAKITVNNPGTVYGYFADDFCSDNSGKTTVKFTKVL